MSSARAAAACAAAASSFPFRRPRRGRWAACRSSADCRLFSPRSARPRLPSAEPESPALSEAPAPRASPPPCAANSSSRPTAPPSSAERSGSHDKRSYASGCGGRRRRSPAASTSPSPESCCCGCCWAGGGSTGSTGGGLGAGRRAARATRRRDGAALRSAGATVAVDGAASAPSSLLCLSVPLLAPAAAAATDASPVPLVQAPPIRTGRRESRCSKSIFFCLPVLHGFDSFDCSDVATCDVSRMMYIYQFSREEVAPKKRGQTNNLDRSRSPQIYSLQIKIIQCKTPPSGNKPPLIQKQNRKHDVSPSTTSRGEPPLSSALSATSPEWSISRRIISRVQPRREGAAAAG